MSLNTVTISKILFKKLYGKSSTSDAREFFEEPFNGKTPIFLDQIWTQSNLIPNSVPPSLINHDDIDGVVQYKKDVVLVPVTGTTNAFYSSELIDAIPFNTGDGSYNYTVKSNTNQIIPFGLGDWLVDGSAGVLTFYGSVPANMPPKITFYKYIGTKGNVLTGATITSAPGDKNLTPNATVGDFQPTGLSISNEPQDASYVQVFVNGILYEVGDGVKTKDCYFVDPSNTTIARNFSGSNKIKSGDNLYWNFTSTGFNLSPTDLVSIIYNKE